MKVLNKLFAWYKEIRLRKYTDRNGVVHDYHCDICGPCDDSHFHV